MNKIVCYTCITGNYDTLVDPAVKSKSVDYICFSDLKLQSNIWKILPIPDELRRFGNVRRQRLVKILAHKFLSLYDVSVWVDANLHILRDIQDLINQCDLSKHDFYVRNHPVRSCVYDEAEACINKKKDNLSTILQLMKQYAVDRYPLKNLLALTNVLIRKHNSKNCIAIELFWAKEIITGSFRDQLSFNYIVWKNNLDYGVLNAIPRIDSLKFFRLSKHANTVEYTLCQAVNVEKQAESSDEARQMLHNRYNDMLNLLAKYNTRILHYIIYWNGKKAEFSNICRLPSLFAIEELIVENCNDKYIDYKNNAHHWTTDYCWKNVVPKLLNDCSIKLDSSKFKKVDFVWNNCDFSYHEDASNAVYAVVDYNSKCTYIGNHEVTRSVNNCPYVGSSLYHSLFTLSHRSGMIYNLSMQKTRKLVINCDSMSVPIIPILACYFSDILVIDNRTGLLYDYYKQILDFKPDYYIGIFTKENLAAGGKYCFLLQ